MTLLETVEWICKQLPDVSRLEAWYLAFALRSLVLYRHERKARGLS